MPFLVVVLLSVPAAATSFRVERVAGASELRLERVSVGLLLVSTERMTVAPEMEDSRTGEWVRSSEAPVDTYVKRGLGRLAVALPEDTSVALWRLDQAAWPQQVFDFEKDPAKLTRLIEGAGQHCSYQECGCTMGAPPLHRGMMAAIEALAGADAERRVIVVFSDGASHYAGYGQNNAVAHELVQRLALDAGVEIHAVGYAFDTSPTWLKRLAQATGGSYTEVVEPFDERRQERNRAIEDALRAIGPRIRPGVVFTIDAARGDWPLLPLVSMALLMLALGGVAVRCVRLRTRARRSDGGLSP